MVEERARQTIKLRLLSLVLALALTWYSINPQPWSARKRIPEVEPPEEKRREFHPPANGDFLRGYASRRTEASEFAHPQADEEDDFEWPEFIDG